MSVNGEMLRRDEREPSGPASYEDGEGGTELMPDSKAGAHIYYRLYTKDGPLESKNPIYSNDRFISRIAPRSVRPPHTAASMMNYLRKIEGLKAVENCALYSSLSEQTPLADSTRLSLRETSGLGSFDLNPMAMVVDTPAVGKRSQAAIEIDPPALPEWDHGARYVYYLVYDEDGEVLSKTSFSKNSPFLGRVNTLSIPPPHTVSSLKSHLIKSEQISGDNFQLFEDESGESTMDDSDVLALVSDTFPGFSEDQPMVIAYDSQGFGTTIGEDQFGPRAPTNPVNGEDPTEIQAQELPEAPSELGQIKEALQKSNEVHTRELAQLRDELDKMRETHLRELGGKESGLDRLKEDLVKLNEAAFMEGASPAQRQELSERPQFAYKMKANRDFVRGRKDSSVWHSVKTGEILYTNGISATRYSVTLKGDCYCYNAINASGKMAYVFASAVTLCCIKMAP